MSSICHLKKTIGYLNEGEDLHGLFAYNEFTEDVEFLKSPIWNEKIKKGKMLDDDDLSEIRFYISTIHDYEPSKHIVAEACLLTSKFNTYHPVKEYIEKTNWDKVPRIDEWLIKSAKCEDNVYVRSASSKVLIAAVNRIYDPGCKFDHMLILEGRQRIGKSTLVEIMAIDWFLDTNFENRDKDLIDSFRGAMLIEISELSGMNKKEVDWLKGFLSRKVDRVRLPYASRSKDFKRKCIFIGTYNPSGNNMYLRDDTGNSRFWPIECKGNIDFEYLKKNRMQLWAEAYCRHKQGEKYYIHEPEALKILQGVHNEREFESPTYVKIKEWVRFRGEVTMNVIIEECLKINMEKQLPKSLASISTTVGIIMRKLKWTKGTNDLKHTYYAPGGGERDPEQETTPHIETQQEVQWEE